MESTVQIESRSTREVEEREVHCLPPLKKIRLDKVAEMLLVLAAMGKMRNGGVGPTDAELELMSEASEALARVCEGFAPSEVFPKDVFGSVIDDLGLKDQKLGFCPPKMSIAQRMLVSKRKMEKAEELSLSSNTQSSQHLPGSGIENRSSQHPPKLFRMAASNQTPASSVCFTSVGTVGNTTSLSYQLPTSEIKPVVPSALPASHVVSNALPRVDQPKLRSDGRSNDPIHALPAQANYSANPSMRTPSWSMQPQAVQSTKIVSGNQVPANTALKMEHGASVGYRIAPQIKSTTTNIKLTAVPPSEGTKQVHASLANTHSEIGKIIQKILQPKVPEHLTWVPPSRDYMSKAMTCQMCMATVTEIDNILICDACEKGYHLKCLQSTNQKGLPRGEWHCRKCLLSSNGKPLPPKYGRVVRNMNTSKISSSNSAAVHPTSSKDVNASHEVSQPPETVNGSTSMQNLLTKTANHSHQVSGAKPEDATKMQDISMDGQVSSERGTHKLMKISDSDCFSSVNSPVGRACDDKMVELKPNTLEVDVDSNLSDHSFTTLNNRDESMVDLKSKTIERLEMVPHSSDKSLMVPNSQHDKSRLPNDESDASKQSLEDHETIKDSKESGAGEILIHNPDLSKDIEDTHQNPSEVASSSAFITKSQSLSDDLHVVNWVGDPVQDLEEKIYFASCSINGCEYRVMDHALVRFDNGKLIPSKLRVMWEDKDTGKKWVTVNRCYFPGDLPDTVGCPCGVESNEVCESSSSSTLLASSIENSCQVLPARKYDEEIERRRQSRAQLNLPPLYICRWIYDEAKGLFRDISC